MAVRMSGLDDATLRLVVILLALALFALEWVP